MRGVWAWEFRIHWKPWRNVWKNLIKSKGRQIELGPYRSVRNRQGPTGYFLTGYTRGFVPYERMSGLGCMQRIF